ncbi:MAG: lysophospholipid acyltransferase family protein [Chloroflexia bacterium]|nr:lysophospholipid acyltransferase family protein [Chloroflexia bacterium]
MLMYHGIRFVRLLAPHVPRTVGYRICVLLGLVLWRFNAPSRRKVEDNLRYILGPDASPLRLQRAVRDTFINLSKDYYELVLLGSIGREEILDSVIASGLDIVDRELAAGKGVIVVFFHTSGFNLAMQQVLTREWQSSVVTEPLAPPAMRRLVDGLRSALGMRLITADRAGVRAVLRTLRANDVVGLAGDRGTSGTGVWVRLFGHPAFMPAGAAALSLRSGACIVPMRTCRLADNRVLLQVEPPIERWRTGEFDADVRSITQALATRFESYIRERPEEWVVARRVWKEPPAVSEATQVPQSGPASVAAVL